MASIVEALQALSTRLDALSARVDARDDRAGPLEALDTLRDALTAGTLQLAALERDVQARSAQSEGMSKRIAALEDVMKAQRGTITALAQQLEFTRAALGDIDRLSIEQPSVERDRRKTATAQLADAPVDVEA